MKKIVLGLLFMMSFSFATTEGAKELVNFLGFTGVSVSLDLAVFVTIILTLITWKITKDKEQNEIKEKYKDSARKSLLEYLGKLRDITKKLIDAMNGKIEVESQINEGTTFRVTLPIIEEEFTEEEIDRSILPLPETVSDSLSVISSLNKEETIALILSHISK